jgi:hypothetical protein
MPKSINKGVVAIPVVVASALMLMAPMLASAQSPHFIRATSSISGDDLKCTFKEAGLGNQPTGTDVTISCTADATAEYECQNRGANNKNPPAENKDTVSEQVDATDDFPVGSNGQVTGSLTVKAPGPGDFSCPSGQNLVLVSATYTNVVLCDETNDICEDLPDVSSA